MTVTRDPWLAVDQVLGALETAWLPEPTHDTPDFYGYHSLPFGEFLIGIEAAKDLLVERLRCWPPCRFLDVGCGLGTKMLLAQAMGWDVAGVEHDPALAAVARRLTGAEITVADAFTFTGYDEADLVYSYRLCVDLDRQHEFEVHIAAHMKPGALLFIAGSDPSVGHPVADMLREV